MLDIGKSTGNLFSESLSDINKLLWFGPLPHISDPSFSGGTSEILKKISENDILSVGVTRNPEKEFKFFNKTGVFDYYSYNYDTVLKYIGKKELPVLKLIEGKF